MPLLLVVYLSSYPSNTYNLYVIIALLLHTIGDIFLIPDNKKVFFILGMISFFIGHIFYAIAFYTSSLNTNLILLAVFIFVFIFIEIRVFLTLKEKDKNFAFLGLFYSLSIVIVFLTIGYRFNNRLLLALIGIIFFSFSDLRIGLGVVGVKEKNHFIVMSTYIIGQILIIGTFILLKS